MFIIIIDSGYSRQLLHHPKKKKQTNKTKQKQKQKQKKLVGIFGRQLSVRLDLFHAVKRFRTIIPKIRIRKS